MKATEATDSTVYSRISLYTHLGMDNKEESTMLLSDNTGILFDYIAVWLFQDYTNYCMSPIIRPVAASVNA